SAFDQLAEDYDFIYAQGFTAWDLLQQKEKGRQLPPICVNLHGLNMFQMVYGLKAQLAGQMLKPFAKVQLQGADYVHSLGGKLTSILIEDLNISRDKIWEIPIGIDKNWLNSDSAWTDSISPRRNFVFIGRYDRVKGIKELNKILGDLAKEYDFSMSFIGPIPESHQVEHPHIKYFGLIKEKERIQEVLKLSDVLICPSHSEGMPTVIMEGMANRCAIIATDVGAVAHQVDSENGWLIEAKDEVALRKALIEAIEVGPEVLRAKQIASFERVKSFTWDRVIDQMLHFFQHHSSSVDITST
ncbi:MAG: glycosyltransferase family 4 protein, partial [Bacteroidota bacterium]